MPLSNASNYVITLFCSVSRRTLRGVKKIISIRKISHFPKLCFFWYYSFSYGPGWLQTCNAANDNLELQILPPPPTDYVDRCCILFCGVLEGNTKLFCARQTSTLLIESQLQPQILSFNLNINSQSVEFFFLCSCKTDLAIFVIHLSEVCLTRVGGIGEW